MIHLLAALTLVVSTSHETSQEKPRVPKDSVEIVAIGCLTGRALKASEARPMCRAGPT